MKINLTKPLRIFFPTLKRDYQITDCAKIYLKANEQVTFINNEDMNYDVVAKEWGFYSTPSINKRLLNEGFKTAIIKNSLSNNIYLTIVSKNKINEFNKYLKSENCFVLEWLENKK